MKDMLDFNKSKFHHTELDSTQEEADTKLILHAAHSARSRYMVVVVASGDTDVLLLCLAFKCFIPASMYVKCGTQTRTRYASISSVAGAVGGELCKCLICTISLVVTE